MKALFAFTIGPVKAFIENSRKMNDLYGGSLILSELTNKAIYYANEEKEFEVIFPLAEKEQNHSNIPNRFIAKVDSFEETNLQLYKNRAEQLKHKIVTEFKGMLVTAFRNVDINDEYKLDIALKQAADFLEIHWLYQPYSNDAEYHIVYNNLFKNLQAVKNIRPFAQSNEFWGRKCTLFPEYNAIIIKKNNKNKYPNHTNTFECRKYIDISANEKLAYLVKPKEALSAIALFKRAYVRESRIKSLRNMLLEFYYEEIESYDGYKSSKNVTHIANAIYDLFNNNEPETEEYPQIAIATAKAICKDITKNKVILSSYYACIKFDGDNMGEVYRTKDEKEQRALSIKICQFAAAAKEIVEKEFKGLCVYAGGEDVLAFLPIPSLFYALEKLHKEFYEKTQLTFSAGIAVAHLMQPLKEVLITAGEMEYTAKHVDGKNAYALSVIKRSGELRTICYKLNHVDDRCYSALNRIDCIMKGLARKDYSKSLIYDIIVTLTQFTDTPEHKFDDGIIQTLIQRIFSQKDIKKITGSNLLEEQFKELWKESTCIQDYINCLDIVGFLSREVLAHV